MKIVWTPPPSASPFYNFAPKPIQQFLKLPIPDGISASLEFRNTREILAPPKTEVVLDKCNLGIIVSVPAFFIQRTIEIHYRDPKCNPPPPPSPPPTPDTFPIARCKGGSCYATFAFWREFDDNEYINQGSGGNVLEPYLTGKGAFPQGWVLCSRGSNKGCTFYDIDKRKPGVACLDGLTGLEIYTYTISYSGDDTSIKFQLPDPNNYSWDDVPDTPPPWKLIKTECFNCKPENNFPPPPPPPKKRCCDDMCCCPDNGNGNDDLLKALLAKVKKLSEIVGVDEYPASLPSSMITKNGKHPDNKQIPNLTQLFGWYIERFDELVGQFEVDIEIGDTDLTKEGNQTETLRFPNIAEAIAELTGVLIKTSINSELLINICNRALIETGQNKQQNFKNYMAVQTIIEYLGFNYDDVQEKLPLTFTPGEISFDKMLKETEISVKVHHYAEKNGLKAQLHELLQAAAIIRAVHWRKINVNEDIAKQLKGTIINAKNNRDKLNKIDFKKLITDLTPKEDTKQ